MLKDKKGLAALIIKSGKLPSKHSDSEPEVDQEESEDSEGIEAAADEILMAIDSKDPKELAAALKAFIEQC